MSEESHLKIKCNIYLWSIKQDQNVIFFSKALFVSISKHLKIHGDKQISHISAAETSNIIEMIIKH